MSAADPLASLGLVALRRDLARAIDVDRGSSVATSRSVPRDPWLLAFLGLVHVLERVEHDLDSLAGDDAPRQGPPPVIPGNLLR